MKVIFIENVENVAKRGESKEVSDGYARNYLFPRELAVRHSSDAEEMIERESERGKSVQERAQRALDEIASRIKKAELVLKRKKNAEGVLFAAIRSRDILSALHSQGIFVPAHTDVTGVPIKHTGNHIVTITLPQNIKEQLHIEVC